MSIPDSPSAADAASWTAPTDVETALLDAKARGDTDAYVHVLARERLCVLLPKRQLSRWRWHPPVKTDESGTSYIEVYTQGLVPESHETEMTPCVTSFPPPMRHVFGGYALKVNPGSPVEAWFPWDKSVFKSWQQLSKTVPHRGEVDPEFALFTDYTRPRSGPVAYGLACGAQLAVTNEVIWNDIRTLRDASNLKDLWGVTDYASWRRQVDHLLMARNSPPQPENALQARKLILDRYPGDPVDSVMWRDVAAAALHDQGADEDYINTVVDAIGQILRYEERFRADGILPAGSGITSAKGYDYGRAVNLARWGFDAGFVDKSEAEQVVVQAGGLVARTYRSWEDYSVGYILGRVLRFDEGSFQGFYDGALKAHQVLMENPQSPWLTIPFER